MTALHDAIAALCAAVDAGDDSALTILADALEEAGDSRAAGARQMIRLAYQPEKTPWGVVWNQVLPGGVIREDTLPADVFRRVHEILGHPVHPPRSRVMKASAAYLALAEALT